MWNGPGYRFDLTRPIQGTQILQEIRNIINAPDHLGRHRGKEKDVHLIATCRALSLPPHVLALAFQSGGSAAPSKDLPHKGSSYNHDSNFLSSSVVATRSSTIFLNLAALFKAPSTPPSSFPTKKSRPVAVSVCTCTLAAIEIPSGSSAPV